MKMKCDCGNDLTYYPYYHFDVFPIGNIFINKECYICNECNSLYCDESLSYLKYKIYKNKTYHFLMNRYNIYLHPEYWMNLNEFAEKIKFDSDFILKNSNFFMKGIYNLKINQEYYFLKKSVELYCKEDDGLFWIDKKNHNIKHSSCHWCGIGDFHLRKNHLIYDKEIGYFNIFYPTMTCTFCGSFSHDETFDELKEKTILKLKEGK